MKTHNDDGNPMHPEDLLWRIRDRSKLIEALAYARITGSDGDEEQMTKGVAEGVYQFGEDFDQYFEAVTAWFDAKRKNGGTA